MQHSNKNTTSSTPQRLQRTSTRRDIQSRRPRSGASPEKTRDIKEAQKVAEKKEGTRINPYIYVGNLAMNTTEKVVEDVFVACGKIHRVTIASSGACTKKPMEPTLYAYVEFRTLSGRDKALKYHGHSILGRRITVSVHPGGLPDVDRTTRSCIDAQNAKIAIDPKR
ncbi:hypothetical protein VNI00_005613 [Paramarasmius palmivorus]|uniref:RRM domain-containing protein n=1 Tax=Paramarasmius palmivorus TaxID=297713 RepID=A0AAW0DDD9_9AGAR